MELRQLITFITIVELDGYKKAADELGYAQSSITAHMKDLEKELGTPIFDRLGRKMVLTEAGKKFLPYAEKIVRLYAKSKEDIQNTSEPSGQLTIGASESLMIYWLPTIIKRFREKYPLVELTMKSIQYDNLTGQLKKGDIDAAILVETLNFNPTELVTNLVKKDELIHVTADAATMPDTMLVTEYTCSWRPLVEEYLKGVGKEMISRVELPSVEAIKQSVLCGLGNAMLPTFTVENYMKSGELQEVHNSKREQVGIFTAMHKNKWVSPSMRAFLEVLES